MELRYYQKEGKAALLDFIQNQEGNPVYAAPPGTGKTTVFNSFIKDVVTQWKGTRIMCVAHEKKIIRQNEATMRRFWPEADCGIYSAGLKRKDTRQDILFTSIQTITKRVEIFGEIHILIIDEAHLVSPHETTNYQRLIAGLRKAYPEMRIIGFSASPYRLGMGLITEGNIFTHMCVDQTTTEWFNRFVAEKHLCRLVTKGTAASVDVSQVHITKGEFDEKEMQELFDTSDTNMAIVRECIKWGSTRNHWLGFAAGVAHAENLTRTFLAHGVSCTYVGGNEISPEEEDRRFKAFEHGEYRCLINVGKATTGYDFPALDFGFIAKATTSTALWIQILGRFIRIFEGKENGLILDFGGNTARLGPINDPVIPRKKKKGEGSGDAPVKECPVCGEQCHTRTRVCEGFLCDGSECNHIFPESSCLERTASTQQVMIDVEETPVIEEALVHQVFYRKHISRAGRECVRVTYQCGATAASEYLYNTDKLRGFWKQCAGKHPLPHSVDDFLERTGELITPHSVKMTINKKFPDVIERIMP